MHAEHEVHDFAYLRMHAEQKGRHREDGETSSSHLAGELLKLPFLFEAHMSREPKPKIEEVLGTSSLLIEMTVEGLK